jgi:hypothetical protein
MSETRIEPMQPNRFEKKTNMSRCVYPRTDERYARGSRTNTGIVRSVLAW